MIQLLFLLLLLMCLLGTFVVTLFIPQSKQSLRPAIGHVLRIAQNSRFCRRATNPSTVVPTAII
ncbi:hypothetical protein fHeYen902_340c [Yersinia phage fHe-Yen9-02]|nr:hypothetical protein fHeYen902_340c [Yersinia phage fHe-Yen9-02]